MRLIIAASYTRVRGRSTGGACRSVELPSNVYDFTAFGPAGPRLPGGAAMVEGSRREAGRHGPPTPGYRRAIAPVLRRLRTASTPIRVARRPVAAPDVGTSTGCAITPATAGHRPQVCAAEEGRYVNATGRPSERTCANGHSPSFADVLVAPRSHASGPEFRANTRSPSHLVWDHARAGGYFFTAARRAGATNLLARYYAAITSSTSRSEAHPLKAAYHHRRRHLQRARFGGGFDYCAPSRIPHRPSKVHGSSAAVTLVTYGAVRACDPRYAAAYPFTLNTQLRERSRLSLVAAVLHNKDRH